MHRIAIERFGGSEGVRDAGMIESAVMFPQQTWSGEYLLGSVSEMAAAYWWGLAKNHGFVDGNKRVGLMAADAFLQFNGVLLIISQEQAEEFTLAVAVSEMTREELAEIIESNCEAISF